jgi:hypothetical protein
LIACTGFGERLHGGYETTAWLKIPMAVQRRSLMLGVAKMAAAVFCIGL